MYKDYLNDDETYGETYSPYGYTTSYGSRTRYTPRKTSWSRSSWSSYSFATAFEDNDDDLMVKDPVSYITPTKQEIKKKTSLWKDDAFTTIKELARICYFKMMDEKEYLREDLADWDKLDDETRGQYAQKKELYDSVFDIYVPGFTPLEQAIAIFRQLEKKSVDEYGDPVGEEGEIDMQKSLGFDRELYNDPTINEQLNYNELSKEKKMDIMNKISIIGDLGTQFKVEKEVDEKIVPNSDQYSKMIMRDYSQFHMIDLYQKMFPNFRTKFLTKDLTVNVPVDRKEQKQKIIIMLDFSGSMDVDEKQIWVNAILIDRFRYVMKGEAEVFFSYFVHNKEDLKFQHIQNREDVIKFWQTFSNDPNGGTTAIGELVEYVAKQVTEEKKLHNLDIDLSEEKPEILIINDGQDRVQSDKFPYKVNAISLIEFSDQLKDLCVATNGKQVKVEYGDIVTAYSKQGEQIISK
jgi:hypothetical protein